MTPRELIEKWEREAGEIDIGDEVDMDEADQTEARVCREHAAELRAALPEQPLSKEWREQADEHDRAANNMGSAMYGGIQAAVLRGCADDLDAQHDEGRELLREVMQEHKGRCACPENYGKHLEKRCVWCRIRKHLEGDSDEA